MHNAYRLSTACALHSFCIQDRPHLPCSVAIALQSPKTQLTLHSHQHALNMHPALPNPLPSTTLLCTQVTQGVVGKMAQDVGMVWVLWCHSILFGWFLRVLTYIMQVMNINSRSKKFGRYGHYGSYTPHCMASIFSLKLHLQLALLGWYVTCNHIKNFFIQKRSLR